MHARRSAMRAALLGLVIVFGLAGAADALQAGDQAPDFTLPGPGGKPVKLASLTAKGPVVLYTFIQAFNGV